MEVVEKIMEGGDPWPSFFNLSNDESDFIQQMLNSHEVEERRDQHSVSGHDDTSK